MKAKTELKVCSGTYFPRTGKPHKEYYVVVDEVIVAGPFSSKKSATQLVAGRPIEALREALASRPGSLKRLEPAYAKHIESVLKEQAKMVLAATGA